jgi:eukaryotic-like serine/threonine-protein kinase
MGVGHRDAMEAGPSGELVMLQAAVAGRFNVEREIGRGGMAIVYRARDLALERPVAIKLLPKKLAAFDDLRERFIREARTAASLAHPHIVPIHLVEADDDVVFFVMGYIDGETLTTRVRRVGTLPPLEVGRIIQEVAWALGYAHGRKIVHRDIKPDNIMIEHGTARTYVTDFGIARRNDDAAMTREGVVLGTAQFMSPEQASGEALDGRSDIYSLGVVAFFALTGQLPFDAPTVQATLLMHITQPPPQIGTLRADLPGLLVDTVNRCLAKEPGARFQFAEELAEALNVLVVPTAEINPLVRNWLRVAEQWLVVVWVLGINASVLAIAAPAMTAMIVFLAVCGALGLSIDLVSRTRQLLREGYTHEDIRFASLLERQLRERELQSVLGDAAARATRRRTVAAAARVAAVGLAGIIVTSLLKRFVPAVPRVVITVAGYMAIIAFTMGIVLALASSARTQRSNLLYFSAVWRRWFGRWFFRAAGLGVRRS